MGIRALLSEAMVTALGGQTDRFRRLDQRRLFRDFRRRWKDVPQLRFSYAERDQFYRLVYEKAIGSGPMDYLEFGCYRGASMRAWLDIDSHPDSRFVGFDSFEGLPEDWHAQAGKGAFDTRGEPPAIDDPRVRFVKGRFQESLRSFLDGFSARAPLLVHLDADLYSSTLFALVTLNPAPGTLLLFDEFGDVLHEFRAFNDYLSAAGRNYEVVAARNDFQKIAVRLCE